MIEVCSKKFTSVSSLIDYEMEKQLGGMTNKSVQDKEKKQTFKKLV